MSSFFIDPYRFDNGADPYWASVALLLRCDGTVGSSSFPDISTAVNTVTAGSTAARVSATQAKWDQSGEFTGVSTSYIKATPIGGEFNISTQTYWTAECWFYQTAGAGAIFGCSNAVGGGNGFRVNTSNLQASNSGTWGTLASWTAASNNAWHHIAVTKDSSTIRVFIDGVLVGTATSVVLGYSSGQPFCIGIASNSNQEPLTGFIDEVRWTNVCRYTATFTPPTAPFPDF